MEYIGKLANWEVETSNVRNLMDKIRAIESMNVTGKIKGPIAYVEES